MNLPVHRPNTNVVDLGEWTVGDTKKTGGFQSAANKSLLGNSQPQTKHGGAASQRKKLCWLPVNCAQTAKNSGEILNWGICAPKRFCRWNRRPIRATGSNARIRLKRNCLVGRKSVETIAGICSH
jgi:hypothetical protein